MANAAIKVDKRDSSKKARDSNDTGYRLRGITVSHDVTRGMSKSEGGWAAAGRTPGSGGGR